MAKDTTSTTSTTRQRRRTPSPKAGAIGAANVKATARATRASPAPADISSEHELIPASRSDMQADSVSVAGKLTVDELLPGHRDALRELASVASENRAELADCSRLMRRIGQRLAAATQERATLTMREQGDSVRAALRLLDAEIHTLTQQRDATRERLGAARAVALLLAQVAGTTRALQDAERRAHQISEEPDQGTINLLALVQALADRAGPSNAVTIIRDEQDRRGMPSMPLTAGGDHPGQGGDGADDE